MSTSFDDYSLFFLLMHSICVSNLTRLYSIRQALHNIADILIEAVVVGNPGLTFDEMRFDLSSSESF
jgi:hypothetical protein